MSDTEDSIHKPETGDLFMEAVVEHDDHEMQKLTELEAECDGVAQDVPLEPSARVSSRLRTQTEKGLSYEIDLFAQRFKSAVSLWCKSVNESTIMSDATDAKLLREVHDKTIDCITEVTDTFHHLCSLPVDEPQMTCHYVQYEEFEAKHNEFLFQISQRIYDVKTENESRGSARSSRSRSQRSRVSNTSKHSEAAAEVAALAAKMKYIDAEARLRAELEKIMTKRKLEMARAKLGVPEEETAGSFGMDLSFPVHDQMKETEAYVETHADFFSKVQPPDVRPKEFPKLSVANPKEAFEQPHDIKPSLPDNTGSKWTLAHGSNAKPALGMSEPKVTFYLDPSAKVFEPSVLQPQPEIAVKNTVGPSGAQAEVPNVEVTQNPVQSRTLQVTETGNLMSEEILKLTKTLAEHTVFDGDPLKFPGWKGAFHTLIELKQIPASEKIHYLRKYLSSSVREVVENYFLLSSEDAFEEAKKLLEQRYGDPFMIGNAFRNKLERWPRNGKGW